MFNKIYKLLLVLLPFHVILSVFVQYKLGVSGFSIYKELLIVVLFVILSADYLKNKKKPNFDKLDYLIFSYIGYLFFISLLNFDSLKALVYGGRYDFEFLIIFLITKHGIHLLTDKLSDYLRLFLKSAGIAILIGILVRFVIGESILIYFGFSPHLSSWSFSEGVPIYHGIEGANVRRFQGIFDGPNQAAFFLIVFSGAVFHYLKARKEYLFYLYTIIFITGGLIFMTYSRSSLLGAVLGLGLTLLLNIKTIINKYKTQFIIVVVSVILLGGAFYIRYGGHMEEIVLRAGSSKGHSERMIIGFNEFVKKPFGHGLASSGPGYRLTHDVTELDEKFFIPESWYVQQMVEGGIIGFALFISIMWIIAVDLYLVSKPFFFSFVSVLVMNIFLHTFEASYISIALFMLLGLFLKIKKSEGVKKLSVIEL